MRLSLVFGVILVRAYNYFCKISSRSWLTRLPSMWVLDRTSGDCRCRGRNAEPHPDESLEKWVVESGHGNVHKQGEHSDQNSKLGAGKSGRFAGGDPAGISAVSSQPTHNQIQRHNVVAQEKEKSNDTLAS